MKILFTITLLLCSTMCFSLTHTTEVKSQFKIGLVTKNINLSFFKEIKQGCIDQAFNKDVKCIHYDLPSGSVRLQLAAIKKLLTQDIDLLAVAVIHSKFLMDNLKVLNKKNIPIITVDADFAKDDLDNNPSFRKAYIGTDNYLLGVEIGKKVNSILDDRKANFCIISGFEYSDNLKMRYEGIMSEIKLKLGEGKSQMNKRCPLFSNEDPKRAINQMMTIINSSKPNSDLIPTIIFTGGWAQLSPVKYKKALLNYKKKLDKKEIIIVSADKLPSQIKLLDQGYSHGNVGQNPYEMGQTVIDVSLKILTGQKIQEVNYTGVQ